MREECFVTEETTGDRIDKFLAEQYEDLSRSFLQKLLKSGEVMVDGRPVKASYKVAEGDLISFEVPEAVEPEIVPEEADIIRRRYGLDGRLPQTQKQVAALYGISRSYVSRIEKKALGKLEEALRGRV